MTNGNTDENTDVSEKASTKGKAKPQSDANTNVDTKGAEKAAPSRARKASSDIGPAEHDAGAERDEKAVSLKSELVQPQSEKAKIPEHDTMLRMEKLQYVTFVFSYDNGQYTEFVLEDVAAISQHENKLTIYCYNSHPFSFHAKNQDIDAFINAWHAKRAGRRNA